MTCVLTIGHSNHEIETFVDLLRQYGVSALADVRSVPASRRFPQYDQAALRAILEAAGVRYVFLGDGFGARPRDAACYSGGRADFDRIRASGTFATAMERLKRGAQTHAVCLMCAEREPADCHRTWLVAEALREAGLPVRHILADGSAEAHDALLRRVAGGDLVSGSLFGDEDEVLSAIARREALRIAARGGAEEDGE